MNVFQLITSLNYYCLLNSMEAAVSER